MKKSFIMGIALLVTALLLTAGGANAQVATAKCTAAKIKCANGKATGLLGCHNKAEGKDVAVDPACLTKVDTKFSTPLKGCMEKADAKPPCFTTGDATTLEAKVDAFVLDVVTELDPGYPTPVLSKCSAGKKKCVANKVKAILGCYGKNATKPDPVALNACIVKAQTKYDGGIVPAKGCFAKLEDKSPNDCLTTGDSAALESKVDAFATDVKSSLGAPVTLRFTLGFPGGTCGNTKDGSSVLIKNLTCGGLSIGGGGALVPEGPQPDGSVSLYSLNCTTASSCTIGPTSITPPVNTTQPDCTDTGCNFGHPLPIANPVIPALTTCVLNAWQAAATGTLDLTTGNASQGVPLNSDIYLTGNVAQPCPVCNAGTCDRGPRAGLPCTTNSTAKVTRDCPSGGTDGTHPCTPGGGACIDGSHVGVITVDLTPLTTGSVSATNSTGQFCPGQAAGTHAGCFGSNACRTITENGLAAPMSVGTPSNTTLGSVFCIAASGNGLVDASADLPGPGATSLPGVFQAN